MTPVHAPGPRDADLPAPRGGVRLATPEQADALAGEGWSVAALDAPATKSGVLAGIGRALGFPRYYGRNLDALWDCLADLDRPTALVWAGWEEFALGDPDGWAGVMGVLKDRADGSDQAADSDQAGGSQADDKDRSADSEQQDAAGAPFLVVLLRTPAAPDGPGVRGARP